MLRRQRKWVGFTIVEILIVIVVVAALVAITVTVYSGIQARARDASIQSALRTALVKIEAYKVSTGSYPATQSVAINENNSSGQVVYVDENCYVGAGNTVKTSAWIPDIDTVLPQNDGGVHSRGQQGCFMYQSDGSSYILGAWNLVNDGPQGSTYYRRVGWRALTNTSQYYLCNNSFVGGMASGTYVAVEDYYKYSYVLSNIGDCDETAPPGA